MQAKHLNAGDCFKIPSIESTFTDLVCLRPADTSVLIRCSVRDSINGPWKHKIRTTIAPGSEIELTGERVNVKNFPDGPDVVEDYKEIKEDTGGVTVVKTMAAKASTRGRKSKSIEFPDTPFEIKELAKIFGTSTTLIYVKVQEAIKNGKMKVAKEIGGKRGKPTKQYKTIK